MFRFELLLDEVGRAMMPAYEMKKSETETGKIYTGGEFKTALEKLESAPVKEMITTYMERINSRGELGVLSSINQRVWSQFKELKKYLELKLK